jgi:glycyl-tRNA synthetase beta chain
LQSFLSTKDGSNLLTAYKRASNIVRIEEKKDGTRHDGAVDPDLLKQAEERALFDRLEDAVPRIDTAVASDGFVQAMAVLAELRVPIDAFFDEVTVNSDDMALRANRLRLLSRIYMALGGVADFSRIEG